MLLALAKKLRTGLTNTGDNALHPVGTLTLIELYNQPRYGEINGQLVRVEGEGNMTGFSPVTKCVDAQGETAWIPSEMVTNISLEPFTFTGGTRGRSIPTPTTTAPGRSRGRARTRTAGSTEPK
jgi:hypothetical protein